MHELGFMFDGKIYLFERLPMSLSSSPNVFTEFMHFSIWALKRDRSDLQYEEVDESLINLDNFIKQADVYERGSTGMLEILFYYLDDVLGGHHVEDKAWEEFSHSEEKTFDFTTTSNKKRKGKTPAQRQQWLRKTCDAIR